VKLLAIVLSVAVLAGCAHGLGDDTVAAGPTAGSERALSVEAPAPRRHLGNFSRGGVYDN